MSSQLLRHSGPAAKGSDARAATGRGSEAYYLVKSSGRGGGSALWKSLMNAIKCKDFEVLSIPLHSKASMYLMPAECLDIEKIWGDTVLFALVKDADFNEWCRRYEASFLRREKNRCRRLKVKLVEKKVVEEAYGWRWEHTIRYLVINDGEKEYEIYPNAIAKRLVQGQTKGSETKAAQDTGSEAIPAAASGSEATGPRTHGSEP